MKFFNTKIVALVAALGLAIPSLALGARSYAGITFDAKEPIAWAGGSVLSTGHIQGTAGANMTVAVIQQVYNGGWLTNNLRNWSVYKGSYYSGPLDVSGIRHSGCHNYRTGVKVGGSAWDWSGSKFLCG